MKLHKPATPVDKLVLIIGNIQFGSSAVKCGHKIHRLISSLTWFVGLPLRLGGSQGGSGIPAYARTTPALSRYDQ